MRRRSRPDARCLWHDEGRLSWLWASPGGRWRRKTTIRDLSKPACVLTALALTVAASPGRASPDPAPGGGGIRDQFEMVLPAGWSVYEQTEAVTGKPSAVGMVIFSAEPLTKAGAATADAESLVRVDTGELPSFFVERTVADKGMKCEKLSRTTVYNIGTTLQQDPSVSTAGRRIFGGGLEPGHKDIEIGGCRGVRFVIQAHEKDPSRHRVIDVRAVSDGKTLYLFSLRNAGVHYASNLEAFDKAVASVRFTSAARK